jgi:hypothetical protein
MEATINEFFCDIADNVRFPQNIIDDRARNNIQAWWNPKIKRRTRMLDKYQKALAFTDKGCFYEGKSPFQDINLLIQIRNELTHHQPETVFLVSEHDPKKISTQDFQVKTKEKFATNPLMLGLCAFFPHKCLSHGCAEWAVENSIKFADEFFNKIGTKVPYEHVRGKLATK